MTVEIIAEIAQGFEGRLEQARLLMKAAASAGADAVKYQLVFADELAAADYKHYALFKSLEMPDDAWSALAAYASELGIRLHLDIFGTRSLKLAERIGAAAIKLHGTDIANAGLLAEVAASSIQRVLLGAGGSHADEMERALQTLGNKDVVVLLGFQSYPTPDDANQIGRIPVVLGRVCRAHRSACVGFADHASPATPLRVALAAAAIGAGAAVIEKHLTLGRVMALEDHESALNPDEFAEFVGTIRGCNAAMGATTNENDFGMSDAEKGYRAMIRRHVVAARTLAPGAVIAPADVSLKRTSAEQPITDPGAVYNRRLNRELLKDAPVLPGDLDTPDGGARR